MTPLRSHETRSLAALLAVASSALAAAPASAQTLAPAGPEILVATDPDRIDAVVVGAAAGGALVVWERDTASAQDSARVLGRAYDAPLTPLGEPFEISAPPAAARETNEFPSIARRPDGSFDVAWTHQAGNRKRILARRVGPAGLSPVLRIASHPFPLGSAVAADAAGTTFVAWNLRACFSLEAGVCWSGTSGRAVASFGLPLGPARALRPFTAGYVEHRPTAVPDATGGGFWVAWAQSAAGSAPQVVLAHVDEAGRPAGPAVPVTSTAPDLGVAALAARPDGSLLLVWEVAPTAGSPGRVQALSLDASGVPEGPEQIVSTPLPGSHIAPAVAARDDGTFVVAWRADGAGGADGDCGAIWGRVLAADGSPLGDPQQLNDFADGCQTDPAVAAEETGDVLVAWRSSASAGPDPDDQTAFLRRFVVVETPAAD